MANPTIQVVAIDPDDYPDAPAQAVRADLADIDEINSYLQFDIQPLTQATEMAAQAVRVLLDLESAARDNPTIAGYLGIACPDWRTPLLTVDDPLQAIIGLVRLTRRHVDHLAEITRVDRPAAAEIPKGEASDIDPDAPRH